MSGSQVILVILLTGALIGGAILLTPPKQIYTPDIITEEASPNNTLYESSEEFFLKNYKTVSCFLKTQKEEIVILQNNNQTTNVRGVPFVICISAGEKRTGGYNLSIKNIILDQESKKIYIDLFLKTPGPGEMVTQAFTYPSIGIEIEENLIEGHWEVIAKIEQEKSQPVFLKKTFLFSL
ncbi:MAG: protease complex subunit PrcB family protein [Defluviitoga tunisiensis]|jgi:hypothetical protein|nr:protease complex subunit PrcB family protein [Defluviitoga tunisiensis]HOP34404.1 protease complex subunit PrcB family protein [Defluviitoga tunisiensis]HPZ66852.1 protease complex subunit PrcB family protein [Defluviitoga tunisiensis]HQD43665.1 protease complex subunit PrcB family protein [Defluviitoga tunisiensis]